MAVPNVRYGSKADMCGAKGHVRSVPIADIRLCVWPPMVLFRIGGVKTVDKAAPLKFVDER